MFYSLCSDASITNLDGITTPSILRYNFYCTGDEARLTDCVISGININSNICGNRRVGLMCETGNIHKLVCILLKKNVTTYSIHRRYDVC